MNFLTGLFSHVLSSGTFPDVWANCVIVPIHVKSDIHCADDCRGVSYLSVGSKCYTSVLYNRLYNCTEECEQKKKKKKKAELQAGFRKGYSTTDHIFTLYAMTQKYLSKKGGKLYVVFVDLRRAFDSVRYSKLLDVLQKKKDFQNTLLKQ